MHFGMNGNSTQPKDDCFAHIYGVWTYWYTICHLFQDCGQWCIREELKGWCVCPVWEELCKGQMAGKELVKLSLCTSFWYWLWGSQESKGGRGEVGWRIGPIWKMTMVKIVSLIMTVYLLGWYILRFYRNNSTEMWYKSANVMVTLK